DRRVVPGESSAAAMDELQHFVDGRAEISYEHVGAAFDTPAEHWLVRKAVHVVDSANGGPVPVGGLVGSSDARFYADGAGIPTIILGPGSMDQAHVADEWVDIAMVERSV